MLGESGIFIGRRPLALKLGPDGEVLEYPQYGALLSSCHRSVPSDEALIAVVSVIPGPCCEVLARFLDIGSDEGAS